MKGVFQSRTGWNISTGQVKYERLNALYILAAYKDTEIDWDKVVNTFAAKHPGRMAVINILDDDKE